MDGAAPNRGDGFDVSLVGRDSPSFTESVFGAPKAKGEEDTAGSAGFEGVPKENGVLGVAGFSAGFWGAANEKGDDVAGFSSTFAGG